MTIHRHIDQLARQGVLRKLHGAVSAQPSGVYESLFRFRETVAGAQKQALARAARGHIEAGHALMLDDSTTASALAPLLPGAGSPTVVTNSLATIALLTDQDGIELIVLGGQYHRTYNAFIGHICETALTRLRADVLVCSASAVDGAVCFVQDPRVVGVKQAIMAAASKRILLVDSRQFGKVALHVLGGLTEFDVVLVDDRLPADTAQPLVDAGVRLHLIATDRQ